METVLNAENAAPVETVEADAKTVEAGSEGSAPSAPKAGTSEETSDWTEKAQKRYHELTRDRYDALRERDIERYEKEQLKQRLEQLEKAKTLEVAPQTFPTLESVGYDEAKFIAAVTAYNKANTDSARAAAREEAQEIIRAEREATRKEQAQRTWVQKESEFKKSKPDYDAKVMREPRDGGPVITEQMAQIISESDLGPAIVYHLAENTELSAQIARLPQLEQAKYIGRIEAKLEAEKSKPKPAVSQAPPPVAKVDGGEAPIEKDPKDMSDKEFAKWRQKQIAARRYT